MPLLGTGFCGALTTFSTMFRWKSSRTLDAGDWGLAAGYATASLVGGLVLVLVATNLVRRARVIVLADPT